MIAVPIARQQRHSSEEETPSVMRAEGSSSGFPGRKTNKAAPAASHKDKLVLYGTEASVPTSSSVGNREAPAVTPPLRIDHPPRSGSSGRVG
jgi:hypothetical protein